MENTTMPAKKKTDIEPGKALRQWRTANGLSQQELAIICGHTQASIASIESGNRRFGKSLARLIEIFRNHPEVLDEYREKIDQLRI